MNSELPLTCDAIDGRLDMGIGNAVLAFAAENHPYFYDPDDNPLTPKIKITDAEIFAREVAVEINRENENGDTLLTDMIDKAIKRAIENGCDGIDYGA